MFSNCICSFPIKVLFKIPAQLGHELIEEFLEDFAHFFFSDINETGSNKTFSNAKTPSLYF